MKLEIVKVVPASHVGRELGMGAVGEDIDAEEMRSHSKEYSTPTVYLRESPDSPLLFVYESGSFHVSGAESAEEADCSVKWWIDSLDVIGVMACMRVMKKPSYLSGI